MQQQENKIDIEDDEDEEQPPFIFVTKIDNFGKVIIGSSEPLEINFENIDSVDIDKILRFKVIEP